MKEMVYYTQMHSLSEKTRQAFQQLLQRGMFENAWMYLDHCFDIIRESHRNHAEIFLTVLKKLV